MDYPREREFKFLSLTHARMVRDRLCEQALGNKDATEEQIERWCCAEGNWKAAIMGTMNYLSDHWDGMGLPGQWCYLQELIAAIQYIYDCERSPTRLAK
jgi:hypothetical protein